MQCHKLIFPCIARHGQGNSNTYWNLIFSAVEKTRKKTHILASLENHLQELQVLTMDSKPSLPPSAEKKYLNKESVYD